MNEPIKFTGWVRRITAGVSGPEVTLKIYLAVPNTPLKQAAERLPEWYTGATAKEVELDLPLDGTEEGESLWQAWRDNKPVTVTVEVGEPSERGRNVGVDIDNYADMED